MPADALLQIENIVKGFPVTGGILGREVMRVYAVRNLSLAIARGETLGLVGESGCGKSTLGRLILRLMEPDSGSIKFDGIDITNFSQRTLRPMRKKTQIIFQDPYASLNPRMTAGKIVEEPLVIHKIGDKKSRKDRVTELFNLVGLSKDALDKYPHEFSGGQRQRIGIARAIAPEPQFIVADEPVSALDLSVRGGILNLLANLREKFSLTCLFITHDLSVVRHISHRVAVMYLGKIMEIFSTEKFDDARHPYTQALVSAVPVPSPVRKKKKIILSGDMPSPHNPPSGCAFSSRCPYAKPLCVEEEPKLLEYEKGFFAACHFIGEMKEKRIGEFEGGL